MPQNSVD